MSSTKANGEDAHRREARTKENYFMADTAIVWFRNDLRVRDNPALSAALAESANVVALFVHETDKALRPIGSAARWWLHRSLRPLAQDLASLGIPLLEAHGEAKASVLRVLREHDARALFWNRRYGPAARQIDSDIKAEAGKHAEKVQSFSATLLTEPWELTTGQGKPYSVFTPFWKSLQQQHIATPLPMPRGRKGPLGRVAPVDADYREPAWASKFARFWDVGEDAARERLSDFLEDELPNYSEGRDIPARPLTSRLSPHLRFGEISPRQIWHSAAALAQKEHLLAAQVDKFLSELAWRDFSYSLLYHREDIANVPMQQKYASMPWRTDDSQFAAWKHGRTGIPIIDAGMRQLWASGWMHNRVRMLVASFLAKNLLIDWRVGEQWFWDCLVDADDANNPASWQWVAGSGADAAPYFRIFNPVTQGERFDAAGQYVREWVPELAQLPDKWIHNPAAAPGDVLRAAKVELGVVYPRPIVDLGLSRQRALDALKQL